MTNLFKKSGQKLTKRLVRVSKKTLKISKTHLEQNLASRISHIKNIKILIFEWLLLILIIISLSISQSIWQAKSYKIPTFTNGGSYTEGTLGAINSLNPIFATTSSEKTLSKLLFATLSTPDYSGHMGPGLASSIKTDDIGKIWTIKLHKNIFWSDNVPITSQDVLYTVKVLQNPNINTSYSSTLNGIKVSTKEDQIIFTLPSPYANFNSALNFPILPAHILSSTPVEKLFEHHFSTQPITSGPFTFRASQTSSDTNNQVVYLNSNPKYFKGEPLLNTFSIHAFNNQKDIINALNSGAITATAEIPATDYKKITNPEIYQKQTAISSGTFAFLNNASPILKNKQLRKAIQIGLDMRSLRAPLGDEIELNLPILTKRVYGLSEPKLPEFDSTKARDLINTHKTQDKIRIATINVGYLPALAENLNFQLKNLGLNTELTIHETGQDFLLSILKPRNYDILVYEIELGSDADLFAYYHSSAIKSGGLNLSNYSNQLTDDLILAARTTIDEKLRATKYASILNHWLDDVPAIGIHQSNLSYFFNKSVRTFSEDNRLIFPTDRFLDINNWAVNPITKNRTP